MHRLVKVLIVIIAVVSACGDDAPSAHVPNDLHVTYEWIEGSVAPPYHYEYTIEVSGDGVSRITMIPGYPLDDVPTWIEDFTASAPDLEALWRTITGAGAFDRSWAEDPEPPVGGASATVSVMSSSGSFTIPHFVLSETDSNAAQRIYDAVEAIVPAEIMEDLLDRRQAHEDSLTG